MNIIQTDITQKDFRAFTKHVAMGTDGGRSSLVLMLGSGLVAAAVIGIIMAVIGVRLAVVNLLAGLFGGVSWMLIFGQLSARNIMGPATDGYVLGPRTVSITDDGIRETSQRHESIFRWTSVRSAEAVGEHIFVMVDRNAGIIVPRRAFASDVDRELFLAEVRIRSCLTPAQASAMKKKCTWCGKEYVGFETVCPIDSHPLEELRD